MCVYDRNAFDCGHQEWGSMTAQCTRYWRKCCIRTGQESFSHQLPGLCHTCQVRRPNDQDIGADDAIHLTIRLKPSMAIDRAALESAKGRAIHPADLPMPDNFKSYIISCVRRYQQAHNIPEDGIKVSDTECTATARGPQPTADAYHHHSCGLSQPNCKKLEDYQLQIMLLEHQNKRRLMMARNEVEAASAAPNQPVTTPSPEETKFQHYRLQDYQRVLMQEALQAKKEQPMSSVPVHSATVAPNPSEPPSLLNEIVMRSRCGEDRKQNEQAMRNLSPGQYHKQPMVLRCGNQKRDRLQFQPAASASTAGVTNESRIASVEPHRPQEGWDRTLPKPTPIPAGAPPMPVRASANSFSTLASADYLKQRQHRSPLEDYNMQLMLLEQQNRKRLMMARQEQDKVARDDAAQVLASENSKPQAEQNATLANPEQEKPTVDGKSNAQESEQILEMGSALGAQKRHGKRSISAVVRPESDDESDVAMWSTDDFDEWSNCEDDMETIEKVDM